MHSAQKRMAKAISLMPWSRHKKKSVIGQICTMPADEAAVCLKKLKVI